MVSDSLKVLTLVCLCHSPQQEVQNIFKAKHPMDTEITKAKVTALFMAFPSRDTVGGSRRSYCVLTRSHGLFPNSPASFAQIIGFGSALLEEVDPNPANFVGAGIIHTKTSQIGCLLRLEPNLQAQVRPFEEIAKNTEVFFLLWCNL